MKITQISEYSLPAVGGLPPLQAMIYEELKRRPDEVFEYQGDELLRVFPRLKRSALNWSLWLLAKGGHIAKLRVRVSGKLATLYGSHEAIKALKARLTQGTEEPKDAGVPMPFDEKEARAAEAL